MERMELNKAKELIVFELPDEELRKIINNLETLAKLMLGNKSIMEELMQ